MVSEYGFKKNHFDSLISTLMLFKTFLSIKRFVIPLFSRQLKTLCYLSPISFLTLLSQSHEPDVFLVTRWWVQESLNYYCGKLGTNRSYPRQVDWSNSISIKGVCKSATTVAWALDYRNLGAQGESRQCILLRI